MKIINKVKDNDCCICAYAMCEGVSWKLSKRRLRKHLRSKKRLGVSAESVHVVGITGYSTVRKGTFETINEAFDFGTGLIFTYWGGGKGHAMYWDGCKIIDNSSTRFHNKRDMEGLFYGGQGVLMLVKKDKIRMITKIKSFISMHLFKWGLIK